MDTVYKYPLQLMDRQTIALPEDAEILHIGPDPAGAPCLWARVDTDVVTTARTFVIVGTGHPIFLVDDSKPPEHIGSYIQNGFVWHVFEERAKLV